MNPTFHREDGTELHLTDPTPRGSVAHDHRVASGSVASASAGGGLPAGPSGVHSHDAITIQLDHDLMASPTGSGVEMTRAGTGGKGTATSTAEKKHHHAAQPSTGGTSEFLSPIPRSGASTPISRSRSSSVARGGSRRGSRQGMALQKKPLKLTEAWPGAHHIRRLFRLFDTDNSGTISPTEFRLGLASLGFDTTNVQQLRALQQELDVDHTGLIRESQFIHAFRTLNRKAIEEKLKSSAGGNAAAGGSIVTDPQNGNCIVDTPVTIQVMKLIHDRTSLNNGTGGVTSHFEHERNILPSDLPELLEKLEAEQNKREEGKRNGGGGAGEKTAAETSSGSGSPPAEGNSSSSPPSSATDSLTWIDVCGLHQGVLALLSNFFLLPHEMLGEEIELESAAHCDFFPGRSEEMESGVGVAGTTNGKGHGSSKHGGGGGSSSLHSIPEKSRSHHPHSKHHPDASPLPSSSITASSHPRSLHHAQSESDLGHVHFSSQTVPASMFAHAHADAQQHATTGGGSGGSVTIEDEHTRASHHAFMHHHHSSSSSTLHHFPSSPSPSSASTSLPPPPPPQSTMKLLIHSLRFKNFPLTQSSDEEHPDKLELVKYRAYKLNRARIQQMPIHLILANDSVLITVRPRHEKDKYHQVGMSALGGVVKVLSPQATVKAVSSFGRSLKRLFFSSSSTSEEEEKKSDEQQEEDEDPNDLFDDFISTLSNTDTTSLHNSTYQLTSSRQLAFALCTDIVETNWSIRDAFREWKIFLSETIEELNISDEYFLLLIQDYLRLSENAVRIFRPLLQTISQLSGEHIDIQNSQSEAMNYKDKLSALYSKDGSGGGGGSGSLRGGSLSSSSSSAASSDTALRSAFLSDCSSSLRLLHRQIARQYDQACLSLTLGKGLSEGYTQRGRDKSNDTLYLLTVVTTIVTPLQIATGVYGMNWTNFPELSDENGYYYFWIVNIALIIMIGLAFKFKEGLTWVREHLR